MLARSPGWQLILTAANVPFQTLVDTFRKYSPLACGSLSQQVTFRHEAVLQS